MTIRTSVLRNKQLKITRANPKFQEQHITEFDAPGGKCMRLAFLPFILSSTIEYNRLDFSVALVGGRKEGGGEGKVVFTQPRVATLCCRWGL